MHLHTPPSPLSNKRALSALGRARSHQNIPERPSVSPDICSRSAETHNLHHKQYITEHEPGNNVGTALLRTKNNRGGRGTTPVFKWILLVNLEGRESVLFFSTLQTRARNAIAMHTGRLMNRTR